MVLGGMFVWDGDHARDGQRTYSATRPAALGVPRLSRTSRGNHLARRDDFGIVCGLRRTRTARTGGNDVPNNATPELARLWAAMEKAYRNLDIACERGLNQTALDRLYDAYTRALTAYQEAERAQKGAVDGRRD